MTSGPISEERVPPWWKRYLPRLLAAEISTMTRYYDRVIETGRVAGDHGYLLSQIDSGTREWYETADDLPDISGETAARRTAILLHGTLNHEHDIVTLLTKIRRRLARSSRVVVVAYNPYLGWLFNLATRLGIRAGDIPSTFITFTDLRNLARLSGLEIVRARNCCYMPWRLLGIGDLINRLLPAIPLLNLLGIATIVVLRPGIRTPASPPPSISVIVPARNERGNIPAAISRLPELEGARELIFVEGGSSDDTWTEIESAARASTSPFPVRAMQQDGKGKADAVRTGFAIAQSDLLAILDADLTVPPERLVQFYDAWHRGYADFINGNRLVYPMEGNAMRFLNRLGNVFFAKMLSWILDVRIGDSLCGTKVLHRHDWKRVQRWKDDFGDFDPFGDFELLFPAAILGLGIVDVPVRYGARTYGETNISRFRHGLMLLRMTMIGLFRIKLGRVPRR